MGNFKTTFCIALLLSFFVFFVGCEYDAVLPPPPPDQVRFQDHVIPYFDLSCNTAGCHDGPNGFKPDLTVEGAYNALWEGNYIDTLTPENSLLYQSMIGDFGTPMPPPVGASTADSELVLKWIEQGALNN